MIPLAIFVLITALLDFLSYRYLKKKQYMIYEVVGLKDTIIATTFIVCRGLTVINLTILLAYVIKPYL